MIHKYCKNKTFTKDDEVDVRESPKIGPPNLLLRKPRTNVKKEDPDLKAHEDEKRRDRQSALLGDFYGMPPSYVSPVYRSLMALPNIVPKIPDLDPYFEDEQVAYNKPKDRKNKKPWKLPGVEEIATDSDDEMEYPPQERLPEGTTPGSYWDFMVYNPRHSKRNASMQIINAIELLKDNSLFENINFTYLEHTNDVVIYPNSRKDEVKIVAALREFYKIELINIGEFEKGGRQVDGLKISPKVLKSSSLDYEIKKAARKYNLDPMELKREYLSRIK